MCSDHAKEWSPKDGWWMVWWMQYQVFVPILALQFLQLFWYVLIWRIAYRYAPSLCPSRFKIVDGFVPPSSAIFDISTSDERSDDEDDDEPDEPEEKPNGFNKKED